MHLRILPLLIVIVAAIGLWAGNSSDTDKEKAEYLFLESVTPFEEGNFTDYYMLLRRAQQLAPDDEFINYYLSEYNLYLLKDDSLALENAYRAMMKRFDKAPDEIVAQRMDFIATSLGKIDDVVKVWETMDSLLPNRTDPAMNMVKALMTRYELKKDTADVDRAISILSRIEKGTGPTPAVALPKIQAFLIKKDTASCYNELTALEAAAPADANTMMLIARIHEFFRNNNEALKFYDRASQLEPESGVVYLGRANFFRSTGDSIAYDREVFQALESPDLDFSNKFELLQDYVLKLYSDSTQQTRIEELFGILQDQNPGEADLHDFYAHYLGAIGDIKGAAEQFGYSLDLDPEHDDRWQNLCSTLLETGDTTATFAATQKAAELFPQNAYYPLVSSSILSQRGDYHEALDILGKADKNIMANDKVRSAIKSTIADILYQINETDSANVMYRQAIELNSENFMAMNNYAYFNAEKGTNLNDAEIYASIATASDSSNPTYLDTYAWVLFKKKEYKKAFEYINNAIKAYGTSVEDICNGDIPDDMGAEIPDHAGDIYFMNGEPETALKLWKTALKNVPEDKQDTKKAIEKKVKSKNLFFNDTEK
ncbi:MAG: hypothetical protein K2L84_01090 [Muribaculaceae bacterium]|nr:hypothetical protein [Muribaculaceae bacterium]